MRQYVVRYQGRGPIPDADRAVIRGRPGVTVVDDFGRMVLIRSSEETAGELARLLPGWLVTPEKTVPLPDTRPRIRSSPGE
jgi:hypothetical protein